MRKFKFKVPATKDQGDTIGHCTDGPDGYRKDALWHYNNSRAHDGLPPIYRMPPGTRYERVKP